MKVLSLVGREGEYYFSHSEEQLWSQKVVKNKDNMRPSGQKQGQLDPESWTLSTTIHRDKGCPFTI